MVASGSGLVRQQTFGNPVGPISEFHLQPPQTSRQPTSEVTENTDALQISAYVRPHRDSASSQNAGRITHLLAGAAGRDAPAQAPGGEVGGGWGDLHGVLPVTVGGPLNSL